MNKVLIIGINGFVGAHLYNELKNSGYKCYGTALNVTDFCSDDIELYKLNILNKEDVLDVLSKIKPQYIINLAAVSSVKSSWSIPQKTFEVNVNGTINILDSVRELDLKTRVLLIGSSEQYGQIDYSKAVNEKSKLNPLNPYGISKVTQETMAKLYSNVYGMDILMVRAFNHIGPGQGKGFVVADFASQIVEIENGIKESIIKVGNLEAERDFTDVRDVVRAYRYILEKGIKGQVYNVGSGRAISIQNILNKLIKECRVEVKVEIDKSKLRPVETPKIECDNTKLKMDTGWELQYSIDKSLNDILEYWRRIE